MYDPNLLHNEPDFVDDLSYREEIIKASANPVSNVPSKKLKLPSDIHSQQYNGSKKCNSSRIVRGAPPSSDKLGSAKIRQGSEVISNTNTLAYSKQNGSTQYKAQSKKTPNLFSFNPDGFQSTPSSKLASPKEPKIMRFRNF